MLVLFQFDCSDGVMVSMLASWVRTPIRSNQRL